MAEPKRFSLVVLGGGNAAGYVAQALVEGGLAPGSLAIVGAEQVVSYERPALSKAVLFPQGAARLPGFHTCVGGGGERHEAAWYEAKGITFLTGTRVESVDVAGKSLRLASGEALSWTDALVIATGADAVTLADFNTPGAQLSGVHQLRSVADADSLLASIKTAQAAGGKAVVVGGGYIGLEVAAGVSLHEGVAVTMVFPEDRLLARLLTPQLAAFYEAYYEARGIRLLKGQLAKELRGNEAGRVASVVLKDGTSLPADLVVVGVGARPASGLFKGQLELDKAGGIVVDGSFQTSVPGVYAIGDVASFPLSSAGGQLARQEHVTHARASAAHVAQVLLGANPGPYEYIPFFYSREFNLSWQAFGQTSGADEVVHWGDASPAAAAAAAAPGAAAPAKFGAFFVKGGRVVGAFIEAPGAEDSAALRKVVAAAPAAAPAELAAQGAAWALAAASKL